MDKKLKAKWVKALMSGKYKQGTRWLYNRGKYCCLGVLDEVGRLNSERRDYLAAAGCGIPISIQKKLANMNDSGIPFPVIAGFIQENL